MLKESVVYPIARDGSVQLVQITDPHLFASCDTQLLGVNTAQSLQAVVNTISEFNLALDLILATGDISQDYSGESYRNFIENISSLKLPCHYLPGNHDDPRLMHLHMQGERVFGERRIIAGNWQLVLLDSTVRGKPGGYISTEEMELIQFAATERPELHMLLVMHHNPIKVGCTWLDQHWMNNGEQFIKQVEKFPQVKGFLWGHVHQTIDELYQGLNGPIQFMATPSTSIQFKPKTPYFCLDTTQPGFRLIELLPDGTMLTQVHRVKGELFSPDSDAQGY